LLLHKLPPACELITDRGYDSGRFRAALAEPGITPCIPSTRSRKVPIPHDATLYRQRHRIEIMFGRLKDWRRIATRDDRCATIFLGAITLAATVIFWLGQSVLSLAAPRDAAGRSRECGSYDVVPSRADRLSRPVSVALACRAARAQT
jgi:transposase